jgi:uncharacterized protein YjeT (DUF2065 family)
MQEVLAALTLVWVLEGLVVVSEGQMLKEVQRLAGEG